MIDVPKGKESYRIKPAEDVTSITVDNVSIALNDEKTLEELFRGWYKENLLIELEKKNRLDLVAKYITPSRIDNWLFLSHGRFWGNRLAYFCKHFEEFKNVCGKGELGKEFALKLLSNGYGKVVVNYTDSFKFYKDKPSERSNPLGLRDENSPEKFEYNNYGKIADIDIITKLISLCQDSQDLLKIKELSEVVRRILGGVSSEIIEQDEYIKFLHKLDNQGYDYAGDNRDKYVDNYNKFFSSAKDNLIMRASEILRQSGDKSATNFLDVFENFNQDILSVMVTFPEGWKYIKSIYESRDGSRIERFKGLNFRKAVKDSLKYYFKFNRLLEIPWMGNTDNYEFSIELLDLGTDDERVNFIKEYMESGLPYLRSFRDSYNWWTSWHRFKIKINALINYFGLKDNVEINKTWRELFDAEEKLNRELFDSYQKKL